MIPEDGAPEAHPLRTDLTLRKRDDSRRGNGPGIGEGGEDRV
jgi:hypothetical protein